MVKSQKTIDFFGQKFVISGFDDDNYFTNIQYNLDQNATLAAIMGHQIRPGATFIDVGANIGITSLIASRYIAENPQIISIEPSRVFVCLEDNMRLNNVFNQTSIQCCVGAEDGTVSFNNALGDSSSSHIGGNETMRMRSLDSIAREMNLSQIDLVKIDVEGFEAGVLDGMEAINQNFCPLIHMEFNAYTLNAIANQSPIDFLRRIVNEYGCFLASTSETNLEKVGPADLVRFLNRHMVQRGCVDDIVFSTNPDRIAAFRL